jgi:type I restriction enzyme, R subunit
MPHFTESTVDDAALSCFRELGYSIANSPHLAPGEIASERNPFADFVLVGRLHETVACLNRAIQNDAREEALQKVLRHDAPSPVGNNRRFHRTLCDGIPVKYRRITELLPMIASG